MYVRTRSSANRRRNGAVGGADGEGNPGWGYDRIVGAMANLGFKLSDQTVANILRRHDSPPAPVSAVEPSPHNNHDHEVASIGRKCSAVYLRLFTAHVSPRTFDRSEN